MKGVVLSAVFLGLSEESFFGWKVTEALPSSTLAERSGQRTMAGFAVPLGKAVEPCLLGITQPRSEGTQTQASEACATYRTWECCS